MILTILFSTLVVTLASAVLQSHHYPVLRIINGEDAEPHSLKSIVYITSSNGNADGICAGTLISPNHVMTAAHCFNDGKTVSSILLGGHNLADEEEDVQIFAGADGMKIHPEYEDGYPSHDIAVVKLKKSAALDNPNIEVGKIPPESAVDNPIDFYSGKHVTAYGWGQTSDQPQSDSDILKKNAGVVQPKGNDYTIVVAREDGNPGFTCLGDSGGPLVLEDTVIGVLAGTEGGKKCSDSKYSFYPRVDKHITWINQAMKEL